MKAKIYVTLKKSVLDPQGKAVGQALSSMGFGGVRDVRMGKYIELEMNGADRAGTEKNIKAMCEKLLANTVIEEYRWEIQN
ncbi:MAG: phosphoribosylformylglycinamidine synthase subunit PurS [Candidatus Omnitrophica bacterium]|nr:phosphoribosylformylglycinamidine synthase subunit PurS [Candidatus Omnitrophota bacterium]